MKPNMDNFPLSKSQVFALAGLACAAAYLWSSYAKRGRKFVVPGSRSTIPDETGHYDMDGVSFDDRCGVVVGSDGRTPKVKAAEKAPKLGKMPRSAI